MKKSRRRPLHPFDVEHGTETGALIPAEKLSTGHRHDRHITAYHGVAPSLFHKLMKRWSDEYAEHSMEETVFLDIGAGKGRAMMLASMYPFRRVVGVELHPALAAVARKNIEVWEETYADVAPMRLVEDDVMRLRFPVGPCLVFLFNPFDAVMMDRFLLRLSRVFAGRSGELDVLYVNDEQREIFAETHPKFRELWRGRVYLSRADADADRATIAHDADGLYVTTGYEDCGIYRFVK